MVQRLTLSSHNKEVLGSSHWQTVFPEEKTLRPAVVAFACVSAMKQCHLV